MTPSQRRQDPVGGRGTDDEAASSSAVVVVVVSGDPAVVEGEGAHAEALRAARAALDLVAPGGPHAHDDDDELLTTREAAGALGVSVSTARRWSDEGRLRTTKTSGGHRRFRVEDLRGLARDAVARPRLRLATAPEVALPEAAAVFEANHDQLLDVVTRTLYEGGSAGWFGRDLSADVLERWFGQLARACRSGSYEEAVAATARLAQRACAAGATALECMLFVERLSGATSRLVSSQETAAGEVKDVLRLFVVLRQAAVA